MTFLVLTAVFLTVALGVIGVAMLLAQRDPAVKRRVNELQLESRGTIAAAPTSVLQVGETRPLRRAVASVGKKVPVSPADVGDLRRELIQAGYRDEGALLFYMGIRVLLAAALPLLLILTVIPGMDSTSALLVLVVSAVLGYLAPSFALRRLIRRRKRRISDALPDALDLLVVCVEAGLGLNQAMMRVGNEMATVEPVISEELNVVNLEMRAGKSRTEALKNLARRTGAEDLSSLVSMLVQTDKFGTSVATSLRVFSDSMRTKRRQRAEELAAKTTIKMIFPLALCILPALFVVTVGPAALLIFETLVKYQP